MGFCSGKAGFEVDRHYLLFKQTNTQPPSFCATGLVGHGYLAVKQELIRGAWLPWQHGDTTLPTT